ncbi:MAG: hypothetical protein O6846_01580 [Thaumarchaeota archaeon]|nr:hypothetical protein [Nitrososphaerota archaeon]
MPQDEIEEFLDEHYPNTFSARGLVRAGIGKPSTNQVHLKALYRKGRILRTAKGQYQSKNPKSYTNALNAAEKSKPSEVGMNEVVDDLSSAASTVTKHRIEVSKKWLIINLILWSTVALLLVINWPLWRS